MMADTFTIPFGCRLDTAFRLGYESAWGEDAPAWEERDGGYRLECPACLTLAWPDEKKCSNCRLTVKKDA